MTGQYNTECQQMSFQGHRLCTYIMLSPDSNKMRLADYNKQDDH